MGSLPGKQAGFLIIIMQLIVASYLEPGDEAKLLAYYQAGIPPGPLVQTITLLLRQ